MPNNVNFQIPFNPQQGQTEQVLAAIQAAYQIKNQQAQTALAQAGQPSQIAEREANTALANAQTEAAQLQTQYRREAVGHLTGTTPGAQPVQSGAPPAPGAPAPAPQSKGLIGDTLDKLLADPSLSSEERSALSAAAQQATMMAYLSPDKAMEGLVSTYNDILKQHGDNTRAIKTDTRPDANSSTGYSEVGVKPDGSEAYRHIVPAPVPKTLEEATSLLGRAALEYNRDPSPGNKASLTLYQLQHDAMYKDHIAEVSRSATASAIARGADYEAMIRTGVNPITKETLNMNNAPPGALVNPTSGQVIPQDMIGLYKPTGQERQTADTARQVLAISNDLRDQISKNPNLIGPLAGRSQEALQKAGLSSQQASKLIDDVSFLQSAATKMHTGRFSGQILDKMGNIIKPGMNAGEFNGALDSINDVASRYANEDKLTTVYEYQQRQQFEAQPPPATPGATAAAAPSIPKGATMKVPGSDGKMHWSDGKQDLGIAH